MKWTGGEAARGKRETAEQLCTWSVLKCLGKTHGAHVPSTFHWHNNIQLKVKLLNCYSVHYDQASNSRNTNKCTVLQRMREIFYIAPKCFDTNISPSSGCRHWNLFKTYSNKFCSIDTTTNECLLWPTLVPYVFKKFRRQFPEDGQIIAPKHAGVM
jgi:hypothetical protein